MRQYCCHVTTDDFPSSGARMYKLREVSDGSLAASRVTREKRLLACLGLQLARALAMVGMVAGFFLVRYRSRKSKVHWKITLLETAVIVMIAVIVSLLIGSTA